MAGEMKRRSIVLDTETTGLSRNDRIIEIACIELFNFKRTHNNFHSYLNPEREIHEEALEVHGITSEFLQDKPKFLDIADQLFDYLNGAELVIHNASFDIRFLNYEFKRTGKDFPAIREVCSVFDTLAYARKYGSGQGNSLDDLAYDYNVDTSMRKKHGAMVDAEILADVFVAMIGEQSSLTVLEKLKRYFS